MPATTDAFLVLSFAGADKVDRTALTEKARRRFAAILGETPTCVIDEPTMLFLSARTPAGSMNERRSGSANPNWISEPGRHVVLLGRSCHERFGARVLDAAALAREFERKEAEVVYRELAPPFAILHSSGPGNGATVTTDHCGLQHLYYYRDECSSWAGISSLPLLLGFLAGCKLNTEVLATYATLGFYIDDRSPVSDVARLPAGCAAHLQAGELRLEDWRGPRNTERADEAGANELAAEGAEIIRGTVESALSAYPEVGISLSGGLDSRVILGAIPHHLRSSVTAMTIRSPGSADYEIAAGLASRYGMRHIGVDIANLEALPGDETLELVRRASSLRNHSADPFNGAVLEWVEKQFPQMPRLGGANGEFCRGFYFPGMPITGPVDRRRVDKLITWRLGPGTVVDGAALSEDFRELLPRAVERDVYALFARYESERENDFAGALDRFYLEGRMRGWAGAEITRASEIRRELLPFFEERFISWAQSSPPDYKRDSRLLARIALKLDPDLATVRMDSGLSPRQLATTGAAARLRGLATATRKGIKKLRQRFLATAKQSVGAGLIHHKVFRELQGVRQQFSRACNSGLLSEDAVRRIERGEVHFNQRTLAFVLLVEWMLEAIDGA